MAITSCITFGELIYPSCPENSSSHPPAENLSFLMETLPLFLCHGLGSISNLLFHLCVHILLSESTFVSDGKSLQFYFLLIFTSLLRNCSDA